MRQIEGPWKAACQLKKPFKGLKPRRGSRWKEPKRKVFPRGGVIDLPFRQINDFFYKKPTEREWVLVTRPGGLGSWRRTGWSGRSVPWSGCRWWKPRKRLRSLAKCQTRPRPYTDGSEKKYQCSTAIIDLSLEAKEVARLRFFDRRNDGGFPSRFYSKRVALGFFTNWFLVKH